MPSTSLQLNQLVGDSSQPHVKKGMLNFAALLGDTVPGTVTGVDAFQSLLNSVLNGNVATDTSTLLGTSPTKTSATTLEDLLKGLPPEIAAILRAQAAMQDGNAVVMDQAAKGNGILDALSVSSDTGKKPELFAVIDDPELAAALAGLNAQISALKAGLAVASPTQTTFSPAILEAAAKIKAAMTDLQGQTITIASLNGDEFQALKKVAFADIAPFLTEPRTVVIDGLKVAKIAQGPSFLNEDTGDVTILSLNASMLAATLSQNKVINPDMQAGLSVTPAVVTDATSDTPQNALLAAMAVPQVTKPAATGAKTGDEFVATGQASVDETALAGNAAATVGNILAPKMGVAKTTATTAVTPNTPAATNSKSRGFGDIITEFAHAAQDPLFVHADGDLAGTVKVPTDQSLNGNPASTLMNASKAGAQHPGMHLVSLALQRNLDPRTPGTERTFSIIMEPGSLGRVKVTLQFGEDNTVKAKLIAERPETLSLLQKDIASLDRVLSSNGFDTASADTFSFDLGNSDSFSQAMNDNGSQTSGHGKSGGNAEFGTEPALVENVVPIFVDPATGLTHVNITV